MKCLSLSALLLLLSSGIALAQESLTTPLTDIAARLRVSAGVSRVWEESHEPSWELKIPLSYGITKHTGVVYSVGYNLDRKSFRQELGLRVVLYGGK